MPIHHVAIVSIPVEDQTCALAFFRDKLGFEVRRDMPMGPGGSRWIEVGLPGDQVTFTLTTWFERLTAGRLQGLVLNTKDIDSTHAELTKKGVKVGEIQAAPWGRYCTLNDPDGNGFVLAQGVAE